MEKRFIEQVLKFKAAILVVTLLLTGVAGVFATRVQFDSSIEIWFLSDDEGLVASVLRNSRIGTALPK